MAGFSSLAQLGRALSFMAAVAISCSAALAESRGMDAAGRYAVLRADDKDTGCMLTLESRASAGGYKAQLAPACRDNGLVIFDPVGWSLDRGRLVLRARKGHKTVFDRAGGGMWRRDPKEGKALSLRPM